MKKFLPLSFCLVLLSVSVLACSSPELNSTEDASVELSSSNTSVEEAPAVVEAERIVVLTSLTADILYRLDANRLVGIPGSRLLKQDARFAELPIVSEGRNPPNLEKIVALEPDLVIGAEGFSDRTLEKLQELGIDTLSTNINSWEALEGVTKTLALVTDADPQPLLARYQSCFANVADTQLSTLVLVSRQPILAPNKNSWTGDLLARFKVENLAAELQGNSQFGGYVTLSAEKILQANPDVLLMVDPSREGILQQFKGESFWQELKATQSDRVYAFDYYGLVNPGSIEAISQACAQLQKIFSASN